MYEKEIIQLTEKLNSLEKLYEQTNQQISNSQELFWSIILGVFAIIGIALYFIAKNMIQLALEEGIKEKLINNPELIGTVTLKSQEKDLNNIRFVKINNDATLNLETDRNDAILTVNHKEVFYKDILKYNSKNYNGYSGNIKVLINGNGLVNILINQLVGGILYKGHWTQCGEIPKEAIPEEEVIYNQIISPDYIVQICIGKDNAPKEHIYIRILSEQNDIENMNILRVPISTSIVYMQKIK